MKTITSALAATVLGLGSFGVAEAQTGYSTICGPMGCTTVPNYSTSYSSTYGPYGYAKPVSTLPSYSTICGPTGCYTTPTSKAPTSVRQDLRFDHRRNDYTNDSRWNDRRYDDFGHRPDRMFDDRFDNRDDRFDLDRNRHDRFEDHHYLNVSNPGRNWR